MTARLPFTKMQSFGNDFVVVNGVRHAVTLERAAVTRLADRRLGIGCDQLLIVAPASGAGADFRMIVYNADGSESGQCGNGARCIARFLREQGLADGDSIALQSGARLMTLRHLPDGAVSVDMGEPCFTPAEVPFEAGEDLPLYELALDDAAGRVQVSALSLGNPHAVLVVDDCAHAEVQTTGRIIGAHRRFPEGANVGFMEIVARDHVRLRVFERGSGETRSCGSGAGAAVAAGIRRGLLDASVRVDMPGGRMALAWRGAGQTVTLSGPVHTVYHGVATVVAGVKMDE